MNPPHTRRPRALFWSTAPSVLPAALMLLVGGIQINNPSLGWDENASWLVSQRSPGQIVEQAQHFDGVISPYYLVLHFWTALFGDSEIALRLPSLIAVALGVGVAGELGRRLFSPGVGLLGALLLVAVPQTSRYAQEARVYGLAFLFATTATLLLYAAIDRGGRWRWLGYGVAVTLTGLAHVFALLMLAGHLFTVLSRWWLSRERSLFRWFPVTTIALLPVLPFLYLGATQRGDQLDWIKDVTPGTVRDAPGAIFGATVAGLLVVGLALAARWPDRALIRELAVLAWVPPAVLIAMSFVMDPVWVPRYVLFVLPALTLSAAAALHGLRLRALIVLVVVAVTAVPEQREIRGPATHMGPDFHAIAQIIEREQQPVDAIVYARSGNWSLRAGIDYQLRGRPHPFDVLLKTPSAEAAQLAAVECTDLACLGRPQRIWYFRQWTTGESLESAGPWAQTLSSDYQEVRVWTATKATLVLLQRRPG